MVILIFGLYVVTKENILEVVMFNVKKKSYRLLIFFINKIIISKLSFNNTVMGSTDYFSHFFIK